MLTSYLSTLSLLLSSSPGLSPPHGFQYFLLSYSQPKFYEAACLSKIETGSARGLSLLHDPLFPLVYRLDFNRPKLSMDWLERSTRVIPRSVTYRWERELLLVIHTKAKLNYLGAVQALLQHNSGYFFENHQLAVRRYKSSVFLVRTGSNTTLYTHQARKSTTEARMGEGARELGMLVFYTEQWTVPV